MDLSDHQTVPYNDGGENVVKNSGTGTDYNAKFYRNATLGDGQGVQLRFKVGGTNSRARFVLRSTPTG